MSTNPRDTQFQGFAKLLNDELVELGGRKWKSIDDYADAHRQIIAQRAYDLTCHTVDHVSETQAAMREVENLTAEEIVCDIPDMTEWPKEGNT